LASFEQPASPSQDAGLMLPRLKETAAWSAAGISDVDDRLTIA
jgi:hypothetical protein